MDLTALNHSLHHHRSGPLYKRLVDLLRPQLQHGTAGDGLPPEREFAQSLGVSRVTLRKALHLLAQEGLLISHRGAGTAIAPPPSRKLSDTFKARGVTPEVRWISRALHAPTTEEIMAFGLPLQAQVARLERLRSLEGQVVGIERCSLPADLLPTPEAIEQSIYAWLEHNSLAPVRAIERISAANVTPRDAETLGLLNGSAVLKVERTAYLASGRVAQTSRSIYRADAYDVVSELTTS